MPTNEDHARDECADFGHCLEELKQVVARKFEGNLAALEAFLQALPYEFT